MSLGIGGVGQGPVSQFVVLNKQKAEQAILANIKDAVDNPAKTIRDLQQPSPLSQFLDVKI
jgi:hypothetical protein